MHIVYAIIAKPGARLVSYNRESMHVCVCVCVCVCGVCTPLRP